MKAALFACLLAAPALFGQKADWEKLDSQVEQIYLKGDMAGAVKAAKEALDAASTPQQTGRSLDRLGFLYYNSGNLKDGESYLRKSLDLRRDKLGRETDDYAQSANDLALCLRDTRRFPEAQALAEEAVAIRTRILDSKDPSLAETLETLGSIYGGEGQYEKSASTFEKARAIYESRIDAQHPAPPEYGTLLVNLAGNYHRLGKYREAERDFATALDVLRKTIGPQHPIYATSLMGPGNLEMEMGNFAQAEKYYNEAEPLLKASLGEKHPMYVQLLDHRAVLYQAMGNRTGAEADYKTALDLRRQIFGPGNLLVASTLRNYGRLVYIRNPAEGERLLREAAEIIGNSQDRPAFEYANALLAWGEAERKRRDYPDAFKTFEKARDIALAGLGAKHQLYANALASLALVHQAMHEPKEAGDLLQQAISIARESEGENHPDVGRYIGDLAALYDQQGDYAAALPLYRQSFEINDHVLSGILNVGSERTKAEELANLDDPLPQLLGFAERAGDKLPAARVLAFEAVARRKGRVLDHVRDWREGLRESTTVQVRDRLSEWQTALECESSLTTVLAYRDLNSPVAGTCALPDYGRLLADLRTGSSDALEQRALKALRDLNRRGDTLEASLSRDVPGFAESEHPAHFDDIRSHLAADELLVEMTAFEKNAEKHYGAFLLDHAGTLQWLDLGSARPIDQAVRDLIEGANDWSVALAHREKEAAASSQQTAEDARGQLSKQLTPLFARLDRDTEIHRLRISPDGMLMLVPFAALSDSAGHFLVQRFAIGYLSAARDLVTMAAATQAAGPPVIALSPGTGTGQAAATAFRADSLERLGGAGPEARALQGIMPRSRLLDEGQATEQAIKALRSPALLHVVGHGVIRGNEEALGGMDPGSRAMNLSAIVLEEAYGRGGKSSQDGLLTALELESLDFHGSQMLVLSQCRMADGVPSSGNGVYGMRRAAAIAGVKTFVAPLWNVSDSAERALMVRFYKELSLGRGRADALRTAMLEAMRAPGEASFLYWAPVILSGDPSPLPKELFAR
ncbi:MAG TPA: CHAT domain-containing tetratricopeptide repeat protein [Bryobacteraceae bacterium]|nr:CHAT domain-containing tetratricopeptide repeat protein [Bryobacteraceae bacterium]